MNPRLVIDASAAICWASPDEAPPITLADAIARGGCIAQALWIYEVHNALLILHQRQRLDTDGYAAACMALAALGVELETPTWQSVGHDVLRLAGAHGLTVYDAAYLELALRQRLPLASFDQQLRKAATAEGLALV